MKTREEEIEKAAKELCPVYGADVAAIERRCGFMDGAQWADEHPKNPWISVKDRLPELYQEVIAINNGKPIQTRRYHLPWCKEDKWQWSKALTKVTHWMPIPETPKGCEA